MTYIWINPVTASMYDTNVLDEFLYHHGYERFATDTDWLSIVKEKYKRAAEEAKRPVMDVRCPMIQTLLSQIDAKEKVTIPDILPILIHCGQEVGESVQLKNAKKVITTPCQALADMGNDLEMDDTWFVPWNKFLEQIGSEPKGKLPQKSPIPPGFFEGLEMKTVSVTGKDEIKEYLSNHLTTDVQIVEMLFCKGGCHNGDGIRRTKDEK